MCTATGQKLTGVTETASGSERKRRRLEGGREGGGRKGDAIRARSREVSSQEEQRSLSWPPSCCRSPEAVRGSQPVGDGAVGGARLYQRPSLLSCCLAPSSRFPKRVGDVPESARHPEQLPPPPYLCLTPCLCCFWSPRGTSCCGRLTEGLRVVPHGELRGLQMPAGGQLGVARRADCFRTSAD